MGMTSCVPPVEQEANTSTQKSPPSRNPTLYLSIGQNEAEFPALELHHVSKEGHQNRLACLGEKVGQLAHDIRNPLSSIECFATLLGREHQSQNERQELAGHCIQAVRVLDQLVSNILVLSTALPAQKEPVNLVALLDDVELLAMYPLRKKGITIHRRIDETLRTIQGHESLLKQVFLNLLMNAIHASTPESLIEIHSRYLSRQTGVLGSQQSENGFLLSIRDHGCGMSQDQLSQMFRPFYSGRKGGTGLGLSIVKQIIHIHHGLIDITSQQGKGTTVEVFLPQ